jgi:hypothetical protein
MPNTTINTRTVHRNTPGYLNCPVCDTWDCDGHVTIVEGWQRSYPHPSADTLEGQVELELEPRGQFYLLDLQSLKPQVQGSIGAHVWACMKGAWEGIPVVHPRAFQEYERTIAKQKVQIKALKEEIDLQGLDVYL